MFLVLELFNAVFLVFLFYLFFVCFIFNHPDVLLLLEPGRSTGMAV